MLFLNVPMNMQFTCTDTESIVLFRPELAQALHPLEIAQRDQAILPHHVPVHPAEGDPEEATDKWRCQLQKSRPASPHRIFVNECSLMALGWYLQASGRWNIFLI